MGIWGRGCGTEIWVAIGANKVGVSTSGLVHCGFIGSLHELFAHNSIRLFRCFAKGSLTKIAECTGCANKKQSPRKNAVFQP